MNLLPSFISHGALFLCLSLSSASAADEQLPIEDGSYLRKESDCEQLRKGKLDFIDFEVVNDGHGFSYPEVACVVAEMKQIRPGRFAVTGDCREIDQIWQSNFFLDVVSKTEIRLNGEQHKLCALKVASKSVSNKQWRKFLSMPKDTICMFSAARDSYYYWWKGVSDDPKDLVRIYPLPAGTEVLLLNSQQRGGFTKGPDGVQLVFEFKSYFVPFSDLSYVGDCGPSR